MVGEGDAEILGGAGLGGGLVVLCGCGRVLVCIWMGALCFAWLAPPA